MSGERLPPYLPPLPSQAYSSGSSSPGAGSVASQTGSLSSVTSAATASSHGPKTPPPSFTLPSNVISGPATSIVRYDAMNQAADMYYPPHMSGGQPAAPQTVTSGGLGHYSQHQPPLLHPGSGAAQYGASGGYNQYAPYANGLTSPPAGGPVSNPMAPAPQTVLPLPGVGGGQAQMQSQYAGFDTTGQQPPAGMKPRVTATLWEDEGSLCFQVEARGICVARREDNHMINGTKLLNVAGMTRGRRDGILKSEKVRHVVKIGPMHLKGVWIPYERALDFANKEKITEMLYPLFVHNIGALLYHPANQNRNNTVMAAADQRKQDAPQLKTPSTPGLPSIQQQQQHHHHHHHQQAQSIGLPGPAQPSLPSHGSIGGRPPLERAHTFPAPPSSASSVMGGMSASDSFNWQNQGMNGSQATASPASSMHNMQGYHPSGQAFDNSRQMYNGQPGQQSPYQASNASGQDRLYGQPGTYPKSDMAPPSSRHEQANSKTGGGIEHGSHGHDDDGEHEHEAEYTHNSAAYDASRSSYNYTAPGVGALANEGNINPDMTGSPGHPSASGRATPRSAAPHQSYYPQNSDYNAPPRVQQTTSSLYNVVAGDRGSANGSGPDVYGTGQDMSSSMTNGYAPQPPLMNGSGAGMKRSRDDGGSDGMDMKRRKTMIETSVSAPTYDALNRPASTISDPRQR